MGTIVVNLIESMILGAIEWQERIVWLTLLVCWGSIANPKVFDQGLVVVAIM